MKYKERYKKIADLDPVLLQKLKVFALGTEYQKNSEFFEGAHMLVSKKFYRADAVEIIKEIVDSINDIIPAEYYLESYISLMPGMTYIHPHSDSVIGVEPHVTHKIHIPIITNDACGHMWVNEGKGNPNLVSHFREGEVYFYDNVSKHSAINLSHSNRYHLIIKYSKDAYHE